MKILIVSPSIALKDVRAKRWTGLDLVVEKIASAYIGRGDEILVVTPHIYKFESAGAKPKWLYGAKLHLGLDVVKAMRMEFGTPCSVDVKTIIKELALAAFRKNISDSIDMFEPDVVHIHTSTKWAKYALEECEKRNVPCVVTLHGINQTNPQVSLRAKTDEAVFFEKLAKSNAVVTCVSSGTVHHMEAIQKQLKDRAWVIPNFCFIKKPNSTEKEIRDRYHLSSNRIVVCIGTLGENKNQALVVRAFSHLSDLGICDAALVLAGLDTTEGQIADLANRLGIGRQVKCTGFLPHDEVSNLLSIAALNVFASKSEGFGLSIIEAMRMGVPSLIYSRMDAALDFQGFESVRMFDHLDDEDLARKMADVLEANGISRNIVKKESDFFDEKSIVDKYYQAMNTAIERIG